MRTSQLQEELRQLWDSANTWSWGNIVKVNKGQILPRHTAKFPLPLGPTQRQAWGALR